MVFWAVLLALVVLAAVAAVLVLLRRRKQAAARRATEAPAAPADPEREQKRAAQRDRLSQLLGSEVRRLEKIASGSGARYRAPWCLVLGEDKSGQSTLLSSTDLHMPLPASAEDRAQKAGCRVWFYDQGVALDLSAQVAADPELVSHLCERLKVERPQLPLNSILLCLPADLLLIPAEGPRRQAALERLTELGERYYALLQHIQKSVSLRIPVYVLVSKSDLVPGFSAFARGLGKEHQAQLFGWSCPYEPDAPYTAAWLDDAFAGLYRTVSLLQLDLISGSRLSEHEREAAFLLPRHLDVLREPLRAVLDPLFKTSVYSETNVLRGFYLTGDASQQRGLLESQREARKFRPLFLSQLFAEKIFAESGLARPLERGLLSGARALLLAKVAVGAAALLSLLLLLSAQIGLGTDARAITAFLGDIPRDSASSRAAVQDRDRFAKQTEQLVQDISEVAARRLARLRLPTSQLSELDDDVRSRMRESFESVVLSGLFFGLDQKSRLLFGSDTSGEGPESDEPPPAGWEPGRRSEQPSYRTVKPQALRDMPEYQELVALGSAYVDFSQHVDLYNNLGTSRRKKFETVGPLVKYVFGLDLNHDLKQHQELVEEALASASYRRFEIEGVRPRAQARARVLWRGLIDRMFVNNPLLLEAQEVQRLVTKLRAENDSGISDYRTLDELRAVLARLESDLGRPELALLNKDTLEFGETYVEILLSLTRLSAKAEFGDDLKAQYVAAFQHLRRTLIEYDIGAVGRLLFFDPEKKRLVLGPDVQAQKAALDGLMGQAFMQPPPDRPPPQSTEGSYRIIWNDNLLRQSIQLAEAYGTFQRDKLGQFVKPLRDVIKQTAVDLLGQNMQALVAQARKVERVPRVWNDAGALQDEIASEVADMRRVSEPLRQVIDTYDKVGLRSAFLEQYRQVADDKQEILRRLDQLLDREDLYRISGKLMGWRGERAPVLDAFDVNDPDALGQYVKATRSRLRIWARDLGKVPVTILDGLGSGAIGDTDPLSRKWREINDDLEAFEKMTPGNSVKEMETFLDTTLMSVTPDNCLDRLPKRTGDQRDYFQQHRARVYDAVRRRCLHFAEEKILSLYRRLAERFNRDLGNKFPFVRTAQLSEPQDATPRDVRGFFLEFDEFMQKYDSFFSRRESSDIAGLGREIDSFLNSLRALRPLFAPVITDSASDAAKYGAQIQYRVNRQSEINGSQVAEWLLTLGDQRLDEGVGQWSVGDRTRLSLRWAKDGPYVPSLKDQAPSATVDGDSISFEFGGFWGMLRLIRTFRAQAADMRRAVDQRPHVLKLVVELAERKGTGRLRILPDSYYTSKGEAPSGAARVAFQYSKAVLFVRIAIGPADSKDTLTVPAEFPAKAPLPRLLEERL